MKLARVNTLLVVAIVLVNVAIIVLPVLPAVLFSSQKHSPTAVRIQKAAAASSQDNQIAANAQQLLVPSMVLDAPIFEGGKKELSKGIWRLPHTSTPDKGSNTVLVAHRFTYTNPRGTFYHLDKISADDRITVLWHGKKYIYKTVSTERVTASAMKVEAPTDMPTLTLYTCTPLWNPKDRLVVTARLEATLDR